MSTTTCFAVGASYFGPNNPPAAPSKTLIGRWNGTTFSTLPSPNPAGATKSQLADVSCSSATDCIAVGSSEKGALVERWRGKGWSIVNGAQLAGAKSSALDGVSCTSSTSCVAVGFELTTTFHTLTLVEQWNGTKWSIVASPSPSATAQLEHVSCTSPTDCSAVGNYESSITFEAVALFEHWNGKRWSVVNAPNGTAPNPRLNGVSCASSTMCVALGTMDTGLIDSFASWTARWNGRNLFLVSTASVKARSVALATVACTSSTNCFAVGQFDNSSFSGRPAPLIERFDGTDWSTSTAAKSAPGTGGWLSGVSCSSPTSCLAVGASVAYLGGGFYRQKTLIEEWNGKKWSSA